MITAIWIAHAVRDLYIMSIIVLYNKTKTLVKSSRCSSNNSSFDVCAYVYLYGIALADGDRGAYSMCKSTAV